MCGITALVGHVGDSESIITAMTASLAHRGPDAAGHYVGDGVALGHRRLAVLDLSPAAAQPMFSGDGAIALVYNGEVYNFKELRSELEARGHQFRSNGDTEVVLRLYEEFGDDFVERLNGMFAFVIWDSRRRRALVARDRFGQKPVFYTDVGGALYVASELKALLCASVPLPRLNLEAVDAYISNNWIPAPLTIYRDIRRLAPGELLTKAFGEPSAIRRYVRSRPAIGKVSYPEAREEVDRLLTAAVERQLVSDVPVGVFLSGGIDSSLVLDRAARGLSPGFDAFCVSFEERERSELAHAEVAADRVGARLHAITVGPRDFANPETLVSAFDEPFADIAAIAILKLSADARRRVTVALTGDGGDELFGGYQVHVAAAVATRLGAPGRLRHWLASASESIPPSAAYRGTVGFLKRALSMAADDWSAVARRLRSNLTPRERMSLLSPALLEELRGSDPFAYLLPREPHGPESLFDPTADRMLGDLFLHKTDIASMTVGLECRAPFLDVPLADFARALPTSFLIKGTKGKRILRDILATTTGPGLARRSKTGLSPPLDMWLRRELSYLLDEFLGDPTREVFEIVSYPDVRRRIDEHRSGTRNHRRVLWSLVLLAAWLEQRKAAGATRGWQPSSAVSLRPGA